MENFVLPYLEWEVLREPITISKVDDIKELPEGQKRIKVDRDERHKLRGILNLEGNYKLLKEFHRSYVAPAGSFAKTFEIQGSDQRGFKCYTLKSCLISGVKISHKGGEPKETTCEANLSLSGVKVEYKTKAEGARDPPSNKPQENTPHLW